MPQQNILHSVLFERLDGAVAEQMKLNSQDVANSLWAYSTCGLMLSDLSTAMAPRAAALLRFCSCQELGTIAWSYAIANVDAPTLFNTSFTGALLERMGKFNVRGLNQLYP